MRAVGVGVRKQKTVRGGVDVLMWPRVPAVGLAVTSAHTAGGQRGCREVWPSETAHFLLSSPYFSVWEMSGAVTTERGLAR